ncbi:unnamed protein product [Closterium sp. NIES-65]|nr:unnamed protein product [Closterium sp. NIES-65]
MTIAFIRYDMPENPVAWEPTDQLMMFHQSLNGVTPHLSSRPPCPLSPSRCRQADPCCPAACIGQMRVGRPKHLCALPAPSTFAHCPPQAPVRTARPKHLCALPAPSTCAHCPPQAPVRTARPKHLCALPAPSTCEDDADPCDNFNCDAEDEWRQCIVRNNEPECECKAGYTEINGDCTGELKEAAREVPRRSLTGGGSATDGSTGGGSATDGSTGGGSATDGSIGGGSATGGSTGGGSATGGSTGGGSATDTSAPVADPCGGACEGNRECVEGVCKCKAGYTEFSGACTVADPCGGRVCEGNRQCVPRNGQGVCECRGGYTEMDGVCSAVCSPACSLYASCQVDNGTAGCKCDAGYTMLGNGECTPACSPPCSGETTCQVDNGIGVCRCSAGYTLLSNGQCKACSHVSTFSLSLSLVSSAGYSPL